MAAFGSVCSGFNHCLSALVEIVGFQGVLTNVHDDGLSFSVMTALATESHRGKAFFSSLCLCGNFLSRQIIKSEIRNSLILLYIPALGTETV